MGLLSPGILATSRGQILKLFIKVNQITYPGVNMNLNEVSRALKKG